MRRATTFSSPTTIFPSYSRTSMKLMMLRRDKNSANGARFSRFFEVAIKNGERFNLAAEN
jgi:hypothetical protein